MKDLTKILKVGDEVYCTLTGRNERVIEINPSKDIVLNINGIHIYVDITGRYFSSFPDGIPVIYPSKENSDWDSWNPIRRGDLVLAWNNDSGGFKYPSIYWGKIFDKHIVLSSMSRYNLEMCKESYDHVERITPEMIEKFLKQVDQ